MEPTRYRWASSTRRFRSCRRTHGRLARICWPRRPPDKMTSIPTMRAGDVAFNGMSNEFMYNLSWLTGSGPVQDALDYNQTINPRTIDLNVSYGGMSIPWSVGLVGIRGWSPLHDQATNQFLGNQHVFERRRVLRLSDERVALPNDVLPRVRRESRHRRIQRAAERLFLRSRTRPRLAKSHLAALRRRVERYADASSRRRSFTQRSAELWRSSANLPAIPALGRRSASKSHTPGRINSVNGILSNSHVVSAGGQASRSPRVSAAPAAVASAVAAAASPSPALLLRVRHQAATQTRARNSCKPTAARVATART